MKKYSCLSFLFLLLCLNLIEIKSQCNVEEAPVGTKFYSKSSLVTKLANVNNEKTIRVVLHIPLKTDGTGNFTETTDYYGVSNQYTGYWLADKFIERSNYWLNNNQEMIQQLSSAPSIPVNVINMQYQLAGVVFHRDDNLYNSRSISVMDDYVDNNIRGVAINAFLYPDSWGNGATWYGYDVCWGNGIKKGYDDYISGNSNNWGIDNGFIHVITHEIGHCLELRHAKRYGSLPSGATTSCCLDDNPACLDNCDDTPTYLELLADGYPNDSCAWGASNNIMDYGPSQQAWTPCQIEIIHTSMESREELYSCGFTEATLHISSDVSNENMAYVGQAVTSSNVVVHEDRGLYINCETFEITGSFEIERGAILEVNAKPKCN